MIGIWGAGRGDILVSCICLCAFFPLAFMDWSFLFINPVYRFETLDTLVAATSCLKSGRTFFL